MTTTRVGTQANNTAICNPLGGAVSQNPVRWPTASRLTFFPRSGCRARCDDGHRFRGDQCAQNDDRGINPSGGRFRAFTLGRARMRFRAVQRVDLQCWPAIVISTAAALSGTKPPPASLTRPVTAQTDVANELKQYVVYGTIWTRILGYSVVHIHGAIDAITKHKAVCRFIITHKANNNYSEKFNTPLQRIFTQTSGLFM